MTNNVQELENYCRSRSLPTPVYNLCAELPASKEKVVKVTIATVDENGQTQFARTEEEARDKAAKAMLKQLMKNSVTVEQLTSNTSQLSIGNSSIHSSEHIDDEVSRIPNPIGYLNEHCSKSRLCQPNYRDKASFGESHQPLFVIECSLDFKGHQLVCEGKGCPKKRAKERAAQQMIRRLKEVESEAIASPQIALNSDLNSYFSKKFQSNADIDQCFIENGTDISRQIEKLAQLLGCRLLYEPNSDNSQVVLKVMIQELNYPLVTTYAIDKTLAAKKAILMLKICYTNQ